MRIYLKNKNYNENKKEMEIINTNIDRDSLQNFKIIRASTAFKPSL